MVKTIDEQYQELKAKLLRLEQYNLLSPGRVRSKSAQRLIEKGWNLWVKYYSSTDPSERRRGLYLVEQARGEVWDALFK